jgi:hypothetical protein
MGPIGTVDGPKIRQIPAFENVTNYAVINNNAKATYTSPKKEAGAGDGARARDIQLGKLTPWFV